MNKIVATVYTSRDNAIVFKRMANDNGWLIAEERYAGDDVLLEFQALNTDEDDMYRLSHNL